MNTILFLSGAGVGALTATILMLVIMAISLRGTSKEPNKRAQEYMDTTERLMKERNDIDRENAVYLCKLAEWCDHNWNK